MNSNSNTHLHEANARVTQTKPDSDDFEKFIYLLSHDVRNSVRALMEIPHWIEADLIDGGHTITGSLGENLKMLNTNARRVDRMLVDLLAHSRVGRMQTVGAVNLEEAINSVMDQHIPPADFKVIQDLQCHVLHIGEQDVLTLLSALISNSIKHHDSGKGTIHISSQQHGGECLIRVQDDGPGIPDKYRDRIFDELTTLKPRDEVEGSGMGLAIVKKIVRLYGGHVACIDSLTGVGTTIELTLQA